jgi:hypothetical protein
MSGSIFSLLPRRSRRAGRDVGDPSFRAANVLPHPDPPRSPLRGGGGSRKVDARNGDGVKSTLPFFPLPPREAESGEGWGGGTPSAMMHRTPPPQPSLLSGCARGGGGR